MRVVKYHVRVVKCMTFFVKYVTSSVKCMTFFVKYVTSSVKYVTCEISDSNYRLALSRQKLHLTRNKNYYFLFCFFFSPNVIYASFEVDTFTHHTMDLLQDP